MLCVCVCVCGRPTNQGLPVSVVSTVCSWLGATLGVLWLVRCPPPPHQASLFAQRQHRLLEQERAAAARVRDAEHRSMEQLKAKQQEVAQVKLSHDAATRAAFQQAEGHLKQVLQAQEVWPTACVPCTPLWVELLPSVVSFVAGACAEL